MKRRLTFGIALAAVLVAGPVFAQSKAKATNVPEIPADIRIFGKMPVGKYLGEGIGVATNSKGHVYIYTRSNPTRIFEFDQAGTYVREIGEGAYGFEFAHDIRVDPQDNLWAVDEGANVIMKFNPAGKIMMVLGHRPEAITGLVAPVPGAPKPAAEKYTFSRPTDVAWDKDGNIFVSDGYGNARVVKYDKNGRYITSIGSEIAGSALGQFSTPHGIAVDAAGTVYVADRANQRVQVLDNNLKNPRAYDNVGNSWTVCVSPGPHQYLFTSNSNPNGNTPGSWDITGEIYKMELDGTIVGRFGHAGKFQGGFQVVHELDCRNPDELYVAEIESWRVQKITLKKSGAN